MLTRKRAALAELTTGSETIPFVTNCPSCLQGLSRQENPGADPVHLAVLLARGHGGDKWPDALASALARSEVITF